MANNRRYYVLQSIGLEIVQPVDENNHGSQTITSADEMAGSYPKYFFSGKILVRDFYIL
jgi:hypothetical protein